MTGLASPHGFSPVRYVLPNGLTLLVAETGTTPSVTLHIAVTAGAACDPPGAPGLSHFLSRTIDRGTITRSADEIADVLDSRGVSLTVSTSVHTLSFTCTCLTEDLEPVLALVADVVRSPAFPVSETETRRGEVVTMIRQDQDNPAIIATDGLLGLLYGDTHPYGRPVRGSLASVSAMTADALRRFHAAAVTPGATTAIIVGDVDPSWCLEAVSLTLGDWRNAAPAMPVPPLLPVSPSAERRRRVVPMMAKAQTEIAYGWIGLARRDPAYEAAWIMNSILGQYALGGRLGERIREREGMAYHVSSALEASVVPGPLVVRAGVSAENVPRALTAIDAELTALAMDGPTDQEVRESRQYLIGSIPRWLETDTAIAGFLQAAEFFGLGLDYHRQVSDRLRAVSRDEVHAVARSLLVPSRAAVVVAGPFDGEIA